MKKLLLASTALVAFAGAAAAEVALSGSAEMGVIGGDNVETQFHTHVDVTFTLSGETDGGISFGASVDLDEAVKITSSNSDPVAIFISGDFGTLTMGDTDGALDWALTEASVGNAGSITDDETGHAGFLGSYLDGAYDGQILRYDYSFGDFAAAFSVELDDAVVARDEGFAIGARYRFNFGGGSVNIGAGYQVATVQAGYLPGNMDVAFIGAYGADTEITAIGVSAAVSLDSGLQASLSYTDFDESATGGFYHLGLSAGYTFDAITVSANYGMYEGDNAALWDVVGYGFAAAYDLGGGLSAHFGYGYSDYFSGADTFNTWSLGLAMSF